MGQRCIIRLFMSVFIRKILIFWIVAFSCAFNLFSQDSILVQPINIRVSNQLLGNVLDSLAKQTNMYFTYNSRIINEDKRVSIYANHLPLRTVLDELLQDSSLYYSIVKKQIVIVRTSENSESKFSEVHENASPFRMTGRIVDAHTRIPLPFVNLGIIGKLQGTTSNSEGIFHLGVTLNNMNDTLRVSFMGYKNAMIVIRNAIDTAVEIELHPKLISLQEVIVRTSDPLILIQSALNRIPENYPQCPANYTAFYRESVRKNKNYTIYLESLLDVYSTPYQRAGNQESTVRLLKGRKIYDVERLDTVSFRLQGGVEGCLNLDIVKHSAEFLQEEKFSLYHYSVTDMVTYNDQSVYVIDCNPRNRGAEILQEGRLFIEVKSLAIVKAELYYPEKTVGRMAKRMITKKTSRLKAKPTQLNYGVSYRCLNGKYYFSHAYGNLKFSAKSKRLFFSNIFHVNFEMVNTTIDTLNVHRIPYKERIHPWIILSKKDLGYDAEFWGRDTHIRPEESIQDAMKRIQQRIFQMNNDLN